MSPSPGLALYLAMQRHQSQPTAPLPQITGACVWLHGNTVQDAALLGRLSETLLHIRPGVAILLTHPLSMPPPPPLPGRATQGLDPRDLPNVEALIAACQPAVLVISAPRLPPALIAIAARHAITVMLVGMTTPRLPGAWRFLPGLARASLRHVTRIFLPEAAQIGAWLAAGARREQLVASGPLSIAPRALSCNGAERDALAEALRHRTVWLAIGIPEAEEALIARAHQQTLRSSHRLMLLLHPRTPSRGPELADAMRAQFTTALRSNDDQIGQDTQVYICDTEGERGLWYRLASAAYMGGSVCPEGSTLDPMEAAALGCAILHGPHHGDFGENYKALLRAKATRPIADEDILGDSVSDVLRPDMAAGLAHQGWKVISEGAETSDALIDATFAALDAKGAG